MSFEEAVEVASLMAQAAERHRRPDGTVDEEAALFWLAQWIRV